MARPPRPAGSPAYDEQKLTDIFRTILNAPDLVLRDDLTARDVPNWDSLNHVNLIVAIEIEFGVRFSMDEVANLQSVGQLKRLLVSLIAGEEPRA